MVPGLPENAGRVERNLRMAGLMQDVVIAI